MYLTLHHLRLIVLEFLEPGATVYIDDCYAGPGTVRIKIMGDQLAWEHAEHDLADALDEVRHLNLIIEIEVLR